MSTEISSLTAAIEKEGGTEYRDIEGEIELLHEATLKQAISENESIQDIINREFCRSFFDMSIRDFHLCAYAYYRENKERGGIYSKEVRVASLACLLLNDRLPIPGFSIPRYIEKMVMEEIKDKSLSDTPRPVFISNSDVVDSLLASKLSAQYRKKIREYMTAQDELYLVETSKPRLERFMELQYQRNRLSRSIILPATSP